MEICSVDIKEGQCRIALYYLNVVSHSISILNSMMCSVRSKLFFHLLRIVPSMSEKVLFEIFPIICVVRVRPLCSYGYQFSIIEVCLRHILITFNIYCRLLLYNMGLRSVSLIDSLPCFTSHNLIS